MLRREEVHPAQAVPAVFLFVEYKNRKGLDKGTIHVIQFEYDGGEFVGSFRYALTREILKRLNRDLRTSGEGKEEGSAESVNIPYHPEK